MQNVEALSQQVHLAHVREWQATLAVEATNAELQYAPSVARADASRAIDAIRAQLPRESALILDERDRRILTITTHVQDISVAAIMREGQFAMATSGKASGIARRAIG